MEGFGQALFRNVQAPFPMYRSEFVNQFMPQRRGPAPAAAAGPMPAPVIPLFGVGIPEVPMDVNPTGAYRTTFNLPSSWKGDHVFLRFEKVASASFVWVNGKQVGYNEGAQEPSEYDITPYVKSGRNTVAVLVLKYSDGFYLEGQDYWRLAGIFDDVTVFAVPKARIRDWQVITDFDKSFTDSDLSVAIDLKAYDVPATGLTLQAVVSRNGVRAASMEQAVPTIAAGENRTIQLRSRVTAPKKWTAETPDLYDLEMTLKDASGRVVDSVTKRIGFKKTEIIDGVFYLNGQPLKISAQCSHMQHPELGHAMDEATVRRDMEILKQFNFNAVRTSHYPPVNEYLDLADEYGLYIIDETGDEAHATEYVSNIPDFIPMYQERVRQMVLRDRNHACVIFWSAGNESGEGPDITEVVKEGRKYDPTRFWMYGGNAAKHPAEDIVGPRYPSPLEHELGYGVDRTDKRPSFMDEYVSVAGNGGGNIDEFWREIDDHPSLLGGALWDFVSPGLTEPVRILTDKSPYGTMANIMGKAKLVKGRTGKAIDMDKVDQWVQVYRADNVEIASDHLTLTLDIYPRQFNKSGGYMITKGSRQFGLRQRGADGIEFYLDNGQVRTISGKLPANWEYNWHNVTAVYDGKEMKIFVDGEQVASGEATGNIRNLPLSLCIGRNEERNGQDTNEYICDALIDNVGVFNAAVLPSDGFDPAAAALWLDFEEETNGGTFYTYGLGARTYGSIWPDRTPQPEMWQMKKSAQPMRFTLLDPRSGLLEIRNRNYFTNASQYKTVWTLTADGETIASGT
ncbi:MAG: beta galactosidase jelly roll domain-containing protein, partial [Bacteroidales bacterium]|nr:beta galactosidase jelly roll domain-containing protein [Bacteroidales bacterium]